MKIELINTGTELMLGAVLNTHQQWLCRQLAGLGYVVTRQVAVADTGPDIEQAVREALTRADLIITTGGLGPTADDLTRDLIAGLLGRTLHEDAAALANIASFFAARNRPMPASTRVQALVPAGALVLPNHNGTAPGLVIRVAPDRSLAGVRPRWLVMLPGPPRELRPMFTGQVVPWLRDTLPLAEAFVCRTLKTTGLGESWVEEKIAGPLQGLIVAGLELGYCAQVGKVDVRLAARGREAQKLVRKAERIVRQKIGDYILGLDEDDAETVVIQLLTRRRRTLALAESCTGGYLTHRLTNVPGASAVVLAGLVTYSNEAKRKFLGVRANLLARHGAVSEPVVRVMAESARKRSGSDYALAITGIAGPGGGTKEKPVGTVFIALATSRRTTVINPVNRYDRDTFKQVTSQQALELLRREMLRR